MIALTHVKLYDYHDYIPDGFVVFDDKIIESGPMSDFNRTGIETLDMEGRLVMPGLINFHTHIYSMLIRGFDIGAHPESFKDVLDQIWWKFDRSLTLEDLKLSAAYYCGESLLHGVTALIDHNASGAISGSLDALDSGLSIPSLLCFETSDRFDVEACLKENTREFLGLHASLSLSDATLEKASSLPQPIHIHVAESMEDETDSWERHDRSVVQRLKQFGLLRADSILAHCVNIDVQEAHLIAQHDCAVALNPSSNMNNAVGTFPYELFREHGITLLVGTDGLGSDIARAWQNLYYVGKQSTRHPAGIGLDEILSHIRASYEFFTRVSGRQTGRIQPGYAADLVVMDYQNPTPMTADNIFGHVFFGLLSRFIPESVFVGGKKLVDSYALIERPQADEEQVQKLWTRIGGNA